MKTLSLQRDNVISPLWQRSNGFMLISRMKKWARRKRSAVRKTDSRNLIFSASQFAAINNWNIFSWVMSAREREEVVVSLRRNNIYVCGMEWHSRTESWWLFIAPGIIAAVQHWILWFATTFPFSYLPADKHLNVHFLFSRNSYRRTLAMTAQFTFFMIFRCR